MDDDLIGLLILTGLGYVAWSHWGDGSALDLSGAFAGLATSGDGAGGVGGDGGDQTAPSDAPLTWGEALAGGSVVMNASDLYGLASQVLGEMGIGDITPSMAAAIALNESGGDPQAVRQEPSINDASYGLMQTLLGTATWLHDSLGYTAWDATTANLLTPAASMYFGCAYLHWLRNYHGVQPDAFVVAAYNGGPGGANGAGPQRYLAAWEQKMASQGWSA